MLSRFGALFLLFVILPMGCSTISNSPPNQNFQIDIPVGDYVFTNRQVNVSASLPAPSDQPVEATITVSGEFGVRTLASGDIRGFDFANNIVAIWDPTEFAPGEYVITAELTSEIGQSRTTKTVKLRNPPSVDVVLESWSVEEGELRANFAAKASSDGAVVQDFH